MSSRPSSAAEAFELYMELHRRGERVDPAAFVARYPDLGDDLASALDAFLSLEASARSAPEDVAMPARIGPYRVLREIGRGGMGVVLEAVEEPLGRRVALKVLPPDQLASPVARERFRREARLASRLDHTGIATIYGAGVEAEQPWIAMRFVEGESLAHKIARSRDAGESCVRLDPSDGSGRAAVLRVAGCLARVARALQYAHEQGIVHRDVKPSNLVIADDGSPVLLDFGLAIGEEADSPALTRTGQTAGTPAYLAPELVSGERARPDMQSDVYALGVTLYECLALRRPFEGATQIALYRAIVSGVASGVRAYNGDVTRDLAVVVSTAMERDPLRRYRSAAALASDLEACAAGRPILARPVPLHGRVIRWARREPRQALLASLLATAAVALALFGGAWWSGRDRVEAADRIGLERQYEVDLQDGYASLATRHSVDADRSFDHALSLRPASIEALVGRALVRLDNNRDDEASALLASAPRSPAMETLRMVIRRESPALDLGAEWLSSATSIELFLDGLRLSQQALAGPRHERKAVCKLAAARYSEAVNRSPSARAFYQVKRAFAARDAGDEVGVRSAAAALSMLWPDSARALFTAGNVLSRYDAKAAMSMLRRSIALDPTWGPPHQILGNLHYWARDHEQAIVEQREAIRLDPRDVDAMNTLASAYAALGCVDEARETYRAALALRPGMFEVWANWGNLEFNQRNWADAEQVLRMATYLAPYEVVPHSLLAQALQARKARAEALAEGEIAAGLDANNAYYWALISGLQISLGRPEEGLEAAEMGLELQPDEPQFVELCKIARSRIEAADPKR